jgi:hypothetical protein
MRYAVEMGSGASFMKIESGIPKLMGEIDIQTHKHQQHGDLLSLRKAG